jgi:uncharacterized membrane-anchored protein YitT (DUF2179 family)
MITFPHKNHWTVNYSVVLLGAFIMATAFVLFITPYKIVPGGIYGVSIIIHYLTLGAFSFAPNGLPVGMMGIILDIPITLVGIRLLGKRFALKSIVGLFSTSIFIDLITFFWGPKPLVEGDILLSSLFGGVLMGLGLGLIFKAKGATGGTDTIAMIFEKYTRIPIGRLLIIIDSMVVILGVIAFRDWKIPLYSLIVIYVTGRVVDSVIQGFGNGKTLFIISDKYEQIRHRILFDLDRGGTFLMAQGMYEGKEKKVIYTNIDRRQLAVLISFIKEIDPNAFVTVIDANEIIGHGFKSIKDPYAK